MNLSEYQKRVEDTWISNENDFIRIVCGLSGELGEICEKLKKYFRKDNYAEKEKKTSWFAVGLILKGEIGDLMYYIAKLCNEFGLDLEEILQENINKLARRKEDGTLKGSGDNR